MYKIISLYLITLLLTFESKAQTAMTLGVKPKLITSVDSVLIKQTKVYLNEVYLNCPEQNDPGSFDKFLERAGRVKIIERKNLPADAVISGDISTLVIKNKCNPSLTSDLKSDVFDITHFNPLKYAFNFSLAETSYISLGRSEYVLEIAPKVQ